MILRYWARLYTKPTAAENALEPAIAALGRRYRAQHPFFSLHHIADFALLDEKVVIEVDGRSHQEPGQVRKDITHTLGLLKMGWRVVRCTNEEAVSNPHATVRELLGARLTHLPGQAELELALLALGPAPVRSVSRRRGRAQARPPAARSRKTRARKVSATPGG